MEKYLYILHNKQFDIDGADSCYKFGMTTNIARRKFDSCYTTAFKYPSVYKKWYQLTTDMPLIGIESAIKSKLRAFHLFGDGKIPVGEEIYCAPLEIVIKIAETELNKLSKSDNFIYSAFTGDNFTKPPSANTSDLILNFGESDKILAMDIISNKIKKQVSLNKKEKALVKSLSWTFSNNMETKDHKCCFCNRQLEKRSFSIANKQWGIKGVAGTGCVKKYKAMYANKDTLSIFKHYFPNKNATGLVLRSSPEIDEICKSPYKILKHYMTYESRWNLGTPAIKNINYSELFPLISNPWDVRGLSYILEAHLYKKSFSFVSRLYVKNMIDYWNKTYGMNWSIKVFQKYLQTNVVENIEFNEEKQVCEYTKYCNNEKEINNYLSAIKQSEPVTSKLIAGIKKWKRKYEEISSELFDDNPLVNSILKDEHGDVWDLLNCQGFVLSGVAGSGKSTLSTYIALSMMEINYVPIFIAPTGKAVSVLLDKINEVATAYDIKPKIKPVTTTVHNYIRMIMSKDHKNNFSQKTIFVIDESGMLDINLFYSLVQILVRFTDAKFIFVGDKNQIQPVGFGNAFNYISTLNSTHLKSSLRDEKSTDGSSPNILQLINDVKNKKINKIPDLLEYENPDLDPTSKFKIEKYSKGAVKKLYKMNYQFLSHTNTICNDINELINKTPHIHNVKKGSNIMILKNGYATDKGLAYYNGQSGVVKEIYYNDNKVISGFTIQNKKEEKIMFTKAHTEEDLEDLVTFADCITVHKSQGSGFDNVCIVIDKPIPHKLLYTAITRYKKNIYILYKSLETQITHQPENINQWMHLKTCKPPDVASMLMSKLKKLNSTKSARCDIYDKNKVGIYRNAHWFWKANKQLIAGEKESILELVDMYNKSI
jgi:hypothetical protein